MFDNRDRITVDSTLADSYGVYGKLSGDSVFTFKKLNFDGVLLTTGSFKDDSLQVPHGKFTYYDWVTPDINYANQSFEVNGKERYISLIGNFLDGLKTGRWVSFYADGKLKQVATYSHGVLHGPYQLFKWNGKLDVQGIFVAGKKNGTWILNGGKREDQYRNDELVSSLTGRKLREKAAQGKN